MKYLSKRRIKRILKKKYLKFIIIFLIIFGLILFLKPTITKRPLNIKTPIEEPLDLATEWLINDINEKGIFNYHYDPKKEEYSTNNNMIRQLMASRVLAELSQEDLSLIRIHKKNLYFIFKYWYREKGDIGYIYYNSKSKLGANAMALRTLVYSPFFDDYEDEAKKLAESILILQNEDGSFKAFLLEPDYDYDEDYLLTFYSGEAILSLVEYYQKTKDRKYLYAAIKSQDYYVNKYVDNLKENYYPAYVPWHTQSLNKLYQITNDRRYAYSIFVLNDELLKIQDTTTPEFLGRFYNPNHPEYGNPHSSSDGVYTEGLAYAYEIASLVKDEEHMETYESAIDIGVQNIIRLQCELLRAKALSVER